MAPKKQKEETTTKPSSPTTSSESSSSVENKKTPAAVKLPSTGSKFLGLVRLPEWLIFLVLLVPTCCILYLTMTLAYQSRTYALRDFGMVIHEFDPWFNFRATQYLSKNGWHAFFHWFDYMSWYPLGRPVGSTIYPGLQITAVAIHRALRYLGKPYAMSLNNVCCTIPCWFGSLTTLTLSMLTYECSGSLAAAAVSSAVMAVIPAHMMRSVGGGFDNECIAMFAMCITFYFWVRSLRTSSSWPFGILTGLAYGYMVAAWGGFIFVVNMISLHAGVVAVLDMMRNRYSSRLFKAYTLYYIIGTFIATRVPPVSYMPFKSLEQLSSTIVFLGLLALHLSEKERIAANVDVLSVKCFQIRIKKLAIIFGIIIFLAMFVAPNGFFGPLSSRVRALFVKHMKTGNPLVDSVAEHRPANADAYWTYLHYGLYGWQLGMISIWFLHKRRLRGALFLFCYGVAAYYFSAKMSRLILLSAPVAASMTGIVIGGIMDWCGRNLLFVRNTAEEEYGEYESELEHIEAMAENNGPSLSAIKRVAAVTLIAIASSVGPKVWSDFAAHSDQLAHGFSQPRVMLRQYVRGRPVIIDDYREAYFWLRDKTPADSRVLSWWDYGYQITGIGNRTTLADGNTWNHEHIATIGVMLSSPVKRAHKLIRHVADYVLVWAGQGNDDLGKSPHMARIGNSVYRGHCTDPLCSQFTFHKPNYDSPTPMMRASLLYNAVSHNVKPGVRMDPKYFTEAYTSKHGLVRIFKVVNISQESKDWAADPANRDCDAPGSWYCVGHYPRAKVWQDLLKRRKNFGQLENFNVKRAADDDAYYQSYMKQMG